MSKLPVPPLLKDIAELRSADVCGLKLFHCTPPFRFSISVLHCYFTIKSERCNQILIKVRGIRAGFGRRSVISAANLPAPRAARVTFRPPSSFPKPCLSSDSRQIPIPVAASSRVPSSPVLPARLPLRAAPRIPLRLSPLCRSSPSFRRLPPPDPLLPERSRPSKMPYPILKKAPPPTLTDILLFSTLLLWQTDCTSAQNITLLR